jgi:hypothetical protein
MSMVFRRSLSALLEERDLPPEAKYGRTDRSLRTAQPILWGGSPGTNILIFTWQIA